MKLKKDHLLFLPAFLLAVIIILSLNSGPIVNDVEPHLRLSDEEGMVSRFTFYCMVFIDEEGGRWMLYNNGTHMLGRTIEITAFGDWRVFWGTSKKEGPAEGAR